MLSPRDLVANPYRRGVVALVMVTLLWRAWTTSRWTWDSDDWIYMADAEQMRFWDYLFQDYNGHLMPGEFAISWLVTVVAPLNFGVAVALTSIGAAASAALWGVAFARVAGERGWVLLCVALVALSPMLIRPTIWWASALQVVPLQLFMAALVIAACGCARHPSTRRLLVLVAVFVAALFFWEKSILLLIPTGAVLLHQSRGTLLQRVRTNLVPLVALAGTGLAYIVLYLKLTESEAGTTEMGLDLSAERSLSDAFSFYSRGFADLLAQGMLGGPWGSLPLSHDFLSRPPAVVGILCATAVLGAAIVSLVLVRGVWIPLLMATGYLLVSWGTVLFSSRYDNLGTDAVNDERYHVDTFSVAVLAVVMVGSLATTAPARFGQLRRAVGLEVGTTRRSTGLGVVSAVLLLSLASANVIASDRIGVHPGKRWVDNIHADVSSLRSTTSIVDGFAPNDVILTAFFPEDSRLSRMLSPMDHVTFDEPAGDLLMVDPVGHLRQVEVADNTRAEVGPVDGCGYSLGPGDSQQIAMSTSLHDWEWVLQVDTFSAEGGRLTVSVGDQDFGLQIGQGAVRRQVWFSGPVPDAVTASMSDDSQVICVTSVVIGTPSVATDSD